MNQRAAGLGKLLASLASVVESLDDDQLEALLSGNFRLEVAGEEVRQKSKHRKERETTHPASPPDGIVVRLREATAVAHGRELLQGFDKATLKAIAKEVQLRINRADDSATLVEKIVRQTITQRLNRAVVRGSSNDVPSAIPIQSEDLRSESPKDGEAEASGH